MIGLVVMVRTIGNILKYVIFIYLSQSFLGCMLSSREVLLRYNLLMSVFPSIGSEK